MEQLAILSTDRMLSERKTGLKADHKRQQCSQGLYLNILTRVRSRFVLFIEKQ